ncbi:hypothetical protein LNP27_01050 [Flavobacterium galactosidilyticum]|uniref:hypothetical protein n=1 Tax=Flavobacterium galactosidilyticum TaxID=2893886 RepID=UPI001E5B8A0B|nr:hypothetical protein [Flavobacterium sp. F-340]UFH46647.1 hypothetical protein LNP27_01050 [Flavobacterium sp. F-340]
MNNKVYHKTELKSSQFITAFFRSFIILMPGIFLFTKTYNNKTVAYVILATFILLSIFLILRTLKTFEIGSEYFVVNRPFLKPEIFKTAKTRKIIFYEFQMARGKHFVLKIITNDTENEFALTYFGEDLRKIISALKRAGVEVENLITSRG